MSTTQGNKHLNINDDFPLVISISLFSDAKESPKGCGGKDEIQQGDYVEYNVLPFCGACVLHIV